MREKVHEGKPVQLPSSSRAGMYLVHVTSNDQSRVEVGKILNPSSPDTF
jgi:hypothetical protein